MKGSEGKKGLEDLMNEFLPTVMAIGEGDINKVVQEINKKVQESPSGEMNVSDTKQVDTTEKQVGS